MLWSSVIIYLFYSYFCVKKNTLALRVLVVMVTGMTDENGWQEIHQVTHTHTHNQENYLHWWQVQALYNYDSVCACMCLCVCGRMCVSSGMSLWQRAALGAPAVLWRWHEFPECIRKHCTAPLRSVQPGNTHTHKEVMHMLVMWWRPVGVMYVVSHILGVWGFFFIRIVVPECCCSEEPTRTSRTTTIRRPFR